MLPPLKKEAIFKLTGQQASHFTPRQAIQNIINRTCFGFKSDTKHAATQKVVPHSSYGMNMHFIHPNNNQKTNSIQLYLLQTT